MASPRYTTWDRVARRYKDFVKGIDATDGVPEYITPAEDEIDSRLASLYPVPFCNTPSMVPGIIGDLATDLAYWKAVGIRNKNGKPIKDYIDERFTGILAGTITVVTSGGVAAALLSQGGGWSSTAGFGSSFGMDDPVNWNVNSAWQQASEDARGG